MAAKTGSNKRLFMYCCDPFDLTTAKLSYVLRTAVLILAVPIPLVNDLYIFMLVFV